MEWDKMLQLDSRFKKVGEEKQTVLLQCSHDLLI